MQDHGSHPERMSRDLRQPGSRQGAASQDEEAVPCGCSDSQSSGSSSPRGPKGGGTLKTCAICIEDYRCTPTLSCSEITFEYGTLQVSNFQPRDGA